MTVLPKPVHVEDLRRAIEQALGGMAASRAAAGETGEATLRSLLADLRSGLDRVREAVAGVAAVVGLVEGVIRQQEATLDVLGEQERLRRERDAMAGEVQRLRTENAALREEQGRALAELEALIRRLRDLPGGQSVTSDTP